MNNLLQNYFLNKKLQKVLDIPSFISVCLTMKKIKKRKLITREELYCLCYKNQQYIDYFNLEFFNYTNCVSSITRQNSVGKIVERNHFYCFKSVCNYSSEFIANIIFSLIRYNNLYFFEYLIKKELYKLTEYSFNNILHYYRLEFLKLILKLGYSIDYKIRNDIKVNIECLQLLHDSHFNFTKNFLLGLIRNKNVNCFMFVFSCIKNLKVNSKFCEVASAYNQLEILKFLYEKGFPLSEECYKYSLNYGGIECLKYLYGQNLPWGQTKCARALYYRKRFPCFEFAYLHGCPLELNDIYPIGNKAKKLVERCNRILIKRNKHICTKF